MASQKKIHIPTINFQEVLVSFQGGIPGRDSCPLIHIFGCSGWKSIETGGKMPFAALHGGDDVIVWKLSKRKWMKLACETAEDYYDGALGGGVVVFVMGFCLWAKTRECSLIYALTIKV